MSQTQAKLIWSVTQFGMQKWGVGGVVDTLLKHELNAIKCTYSSRAQGNIVALRNAVIQRGVSGKFAPIEGKLPLLLSLVGRKAILSVPNATMSIVEQEKVEVQLCVDSNFCTDDVVADAQGSTLEIKVTSAGQLQSVQEGAVLSFSYGAADVRVTRVLTRSETTLVVECVVEHGGLLRSGMEVHSDSMSRALFPLLPVDAESLATGFYGLADFVVVNGIHTLEEFFQIKKAFVGDAKRTSLRHPSVAITENILEAEASLAPRFLLKIDSQAALNLLPKVLDFADGIFLSRSELGLDLHPHDLPILQKELTLQCNRLAKIVVVESELMHSMRVNSNPTRAEVSDMANAAADGVDALVLAAEVTHGPHSDLVAQVSRETLLNSEAWQEKKWLPIEMSSIPTEDDAVTYGAIRIAEQAGVKAIVCFTEGGYTAMKLSSMRTPIPIIAVTCNKKIMRQMNLLRSVRAVVLDVRSQMEKILSETKGLLVQDFDFKLGDQFVFVSLTASSIAARNSNLFTLQVID